MQPFLGQIQCFSFEFAPRGWAACNGQTMSIDQNKALFGLISTTFGGNGVTTFNLPDLRGRLIHGAGRDLTFGEFDGQESVPMGAGDIPPHSHAVMVSSKTSVGTQQEGNYLGKAAIYVNADPDTILNAVTVLGNNATSNMPISVAQPCLAINWCIALAGIFPSRN